MSLRLIPEGAVIERSYLAIPGHYGTSEAEFPNTDEGWNAAVAAAKEKVAKRIEMLTESIGKYASPEEIEQIALNTRIDLRWEIAYPDGGGINTVVESFRDVSRLRTYAEVGGNR